MSSKNTKRSRTHQTELNSNSPPINISDTDRFLQILEALRVEYSIMRQHMSDYQEERGSIINYVLILTIGAASAVGFDIYTKYPMSLLVVPLFVFVLATLFMDRTLRILRTADYLHNYLRPRMVSLLGFDTFLYDQYKRGLKSRARFILIAIDRFRWAIFLLPMLASIGIYLVSMYPLTSLLEKIWIGIDLLLCLIVLLYAFQVEETTPPETDVDTEVDRAGIIGASTQPSSTPDKP